MRTANPDNQFVARLAQWCLGFSLLLAPLVFAQAGDYYEFKPDQKLKPHLTYFGDKQGQHTIHTLLKNAPNFQPLDQKPVLNNAKTHWYRLALANPSAQQTRWLISTGVASVFTLNAYWVNAEGVSLIPPKQAISHFANQTNKRVELEMSAFDQGHLYIQYEGIAQFPLDLQILSPQQYLDRTFKFTLFNGMALGVISIFALLFCVQFAFSRKKVLGFYCLYILCIFVFAIQVFGYGVRFYWPDQLRLDSHLTHLAAGFIYCFYFLFTAYLFEHKHYVRKGLLALSWTTGLASILGLFVDLDFALTIIVAAGMPIAIFAGIAARKHTPLTAYYFLAGSLVHYTFTCLLLLMLLGVSLGTWVFGLSTFGQLVDILCFSIAILVQSQKTELLLNTQVAERIKDLKSLNESEQTAATLTKIHRESLLDATSTAHDLQQVISSIRLQLAAQNTPSEASKRLEQSLEYACALLSQKIGQGKSHFLGSRKATPIHTLLNSIVSAHQPTHPKLRVKAHPALVECSTLAVQRIIENLLNNAFAHANTDKVLVTGRKRHKAYRIQIWDMGKGIDANQLERIFEPFNRITQEGSNIKVMGHGLGLHIVRFLCEEFDYRFSIRSKLEKGTCFIVDIDGAQVSAEWSLANKEAASLPQ